MLFFFPFSQKLCCCFSFSALLFPSFFQYHTLVLESIACVWCIKVCCQTITFDQKNKNKNSIKIISNWKWFNEEKEEIYHDEISQEDKKKIMKRKLIFCTSKNQNKYRKIHIKMVSRPQIFELFGFGLSFSFEV